MGYHHGDLKIIDTNLLSGSAEVFRTSMGGYWQILSSSEGEQLESIYYYDSDDTVDSPYNPFISAVYANTDLRTIIEEDVIIPNSKLPIRIIGDSDTVLSDDHWKTLWLGGTFAGVNYDALYTESTFDNYSFDYEIPYSMQEAKFILDNESLDDIAQLTYNYNHYLPKYQDYINGLDSELLIPNMYFFKMYQTYAGNNPINTTIADFVTLEGTYETANSLLDEVEEEIDTEGNMINMEDSQIYQYLTSSIIVTALSASTQTKIKNILQNIMFDTNVIKADNYKDMDDGKNNIPFYVSFNFDHQSDSDSDKTFFSYMRQNDYSAKFLKTLKETFNDEITLKTTDQESVVESAYFSGSTDLSTNTYTINTINKSYRAANFMDMLQYGYLNFISTSDNCFYMGTETTGRVAAMDPSGSYRYRNSLNSLGMINSVVAYLEDTSNFNIESLEELYDLDFKYNETLAYRIEKIGGPPTGDSQTQNVLQNFWFVNSNEFTEGNEFYDSQVKYNRDYTYNIYAYVLVVGIKYSFSDLVISRQIGTTDVATDVGTYCTELYDPFTGEASSQLLVDESTLAAADNTFASNAQIISSNKYIADFYLDYEPSLKLIEIPIMSKTLKVLDNPPNQINVIPYQMMDASQRIGYTLYYEIFNDTATYPTTITADDDKIKAEYLHGKDLLVSEFMEQESISKQRYLEVYRMKEKPTRITDFANHLINTLDLKEGLSIKSVENFIQSVRANTQYYYLFRMLNEQQMPGHLTEIYEAQLINDGGYIYSIFNVLFEEDLEEDIFVNPSKIFKKLFHLTPNLSQLTLITEDVDYTEPAYTQIGNMDVGEADDLIWGKQFKIRLTSKKTGKKIDLNFTYNLESD
jgi:hypothetical protein